MMQKTIFQLICCFLPFMLFSQTESDEVFVGVYQWNQRPNEYNRIKVVIRQAQDGRLKVTCQFEFDGVDLEYSGIAVRDSKTNTIQGEVHNPGQNRTYFFQGQVWGKVLRGTHAELKRKRRVPTGTFILKKVE